MTKQTVKKSNAVIEDLEAYIAELEETLVYVREKKVQPVVVEVKKEGRMQQVLDVFKKHGHVSVPKIASIVGIDARNVSSQMNYLKNGKLDGKCYEICTDAKGYKFIANL